MEVGLVLGYAGDVAGPSAARLAKCASRYAQDDEFVEVRRTA